MYIISYIYYTSCDISINSVNGRPLLGMAIWPSQQRRAEDELFVCQRVSATDGEMAPSVT